MARYEIDPEPNDEYYDKCDHKWVADRYQLRYHYCKRCGKSEMCVIDPVTFKCKICGKSFI